MKTLVSLVSVALLVSCGGSADDPEREVTFTRLEAAYGGAMPPGTYEFRSQDELNEAWKRFEPYPVLDPSIELKPPTVDFRVYTVLGISFGWAATPCEAVAVTGVRATSTRVVVDYVINTIPPGAACSTVVVPSREFILVPRTEAEIEFRNKGA